MHLKLVLSNEAPTPRVVGSKGVVVEVVSRFDGGRMTFPTPHPSPAVCEISLHRGRERTATAVYEALRKATVLFSSTYARRTDAMMPAMFGRLVVR